MRNPQSRTPQGLRSKRNSKRRLSRPALPADEGDRLRPLIASTPVRARLSLGDAIRTLERAEEIASRPMLH